MGSSSLRVLVSSLPRLRPGSDRGSDKIGRANGSDHRREAARALPSRARNPEAGAAEAAAPFPTRRPPATFAASGPSRAPARSSANSDQESRQVQFAVRDADAMEPVRRFAGGLREAMEENGHRPVDDARRAGLVVQGFRPEEPAAFRRRSRSVFVVGLTAVPGPLEDPLAEGYPLLVRSLSNLLIVLAGEGPHPTAHFFTPERGHYVVEAGGEGASDPGPGAGADPYFDAVYRRLEPLATSTLVIDNVFDRDLPPELRDGDEKTGALGRAGRRLDDLELLPAPFPLEEVLPDPDRRHLEKLFGIGGLSYGNLSVRKDERRFWMSASGVDKSRLEEVGREILLVKGYDRDRNAMRLSVPPDVEPARVSVDAIEHWTIYREHPGVGAIVHVHAWMDGVPVTRFNYPCGTRELARAVAARVDEADDPTRAVVGLKNHGLTITGRSLEGIFDRIEDRIRPQVPMA